MSYEEESYKLKVIKDNEVSTTMFTYDNDHDFSGFWFYIDNNNSYGVNDKGEIVNSASTSFNLGSDTFVRRVNLDEGEIDKTQSVKNSERMIYIENKALVDGTLLYNEDTLIIENSSDPNWVGNYYVEFNESENKKIQLIIKIDKENINKSGIIRQIGFNYTLDNNNIELNGLGVSFNIIDINSNIVYAYRSRNIINEKFVNYQDNDNIYVTNNTTLLGVHLTSTVKSIGYHAFNNCIRLTQIKISNGIETIYDYSFTSCANLEQVTIPDSVTSIGSFAFQYCTNLEQVTIPNIIKSIDNSAFIDCNKIDTINITNYNDGDEINEGIIKAFKISENTHTLNDPDTTDNTITYTKNPIQ